MQSDAVVHVIDDDDAVRQSLAFLLRSARHRGARPTKARRPSWLRGRRSGSGCIITDVRMPEISGIELLRRLNELKVAVPVIVITGHGDVPLAVEAMKLGAVDFFEKPFDDEALLAAVRSALDQQHRRQQAQRRTRGDQRQARLAVEPRAPGAGRTGERAPQQDDRIRPRHQPADRRNLPGQPDDQDERGEPVGPGSHGAGGWNSRPRPKAGKLKGCRASSTAAPAGSAVEIDQGAVGWACA